jgi:hypothetical protein
MPKVITMQERGKQESMYMRDTKRQNLQQQKHQRTRYTPLVILVILKTKLIP